MDTKHNDNSKVAHSSSNTKRDSKLDDSPTDITMPNPSPMVVRNDKFRGVPVSTTIDPHDGKTKTCDRDHTFDAFLPQDKMPEEDKTKRMGHTWEVVRAVKRLRKLKKPLRKLAHRRKNRRIDDGGVDMENLISVKH